MSEVNLRREKYGFNELKAKQRTPRLTIYIRQFKNSIVFLLVLAASVSFIFQDYTEGVAIIAVIFINSIIGYILESQAIRSMEALKRLDKVMAKVMRSGQLGEVEAKELVPGDVIMLEAGDLVPADARILEMAHIEMNESTLTGESIPVVKEVNLLHAEATVLGDRTNMLFKGTSVSKGNAKAIVVATGQYTEIGNISSMMESAEKEEVPLNRKLDVFSKKLIWLTILIILPFVVFGLLREDNLYLLIETAIALAVAAIPEGLPIVATISLARGMLNLSKSRVIVKKLAAVETLGETDLIMTDKTGTLTKNDLQVGALALTDDDSSEVIEDFVKVAVMCNNAALDNEQGLGDPVEVALLRWVKGHDADMISTIQLQWKEIEERPFDSERKFMSTLYQSKAGAYFSAAKGSTEVILELCTQQGNQPLSATMRKQWIDKTSDLAKEGYKVLAFACAAHQTIPAIHDQQLQFLGLVGFIDPPREEVSAAINECHQAGIKVVMVTGDHPETAVAIANQINLVPSGNVVQSIHGRDLIVNDQNAALIDKTQIFSRVTPQQKMELVDYFHSKNMIVGMTGDGVNDAPALKKADIGIAMGLRGTQVAEEAADMILQDDSFTSIVVAIRQGRIIFNNIKNFVIYLLSCNLTEIMVVAIAAFSNLSLPLLPLQILFLNLVTDIFPALALGMGLGSKDIMKNQSRKPNDPILNRDNWLSIILYAAVMTVSIFSLFVYSTFVMHNDPAISNNMAFFTLALAQLWHPFNLIKGESGFLKNEIISNKHLWFAILFCLAILAVTYFTPALAALLSIGKLSLNTWLYIVAASLLPVVIIRCIKWLKVK